MARIKSRWICQECGFESPRSLGRCTECSAWNTFVEETISESRSGLTGKQAESSSPLLLNEITYDDSFRMNTGISGLDRVLGGGLVPGSVILLAGDPGIGKSTLLLQIADVLSSAGSVIYITGEESRQQVKLRAQRLCLTGDGMLVHAEQNILSIEKALSEVTSSVAVIDSIQSVYHPDIASAPGSVSQVRESAVVLITAAKAKNIATILVGHVTKDGSIAGPRVLEHMVDVVLQFTGDRSRQLRMLRATKNRFGSTQEVSIFTMAAGGLREVDNPSTLFLGTRLSRGQRAPSGTAVISTMEGTSSLILEVEALVGASPYPGPRRVANGWDYNRLLQILAVFEKKLGLLLSKSDVYVNTVGGFEFNDPAGDLGVALAIATSRLDRSTDPHLILIGEIGLTGEVRPVSSIERRLREAANLGFRQAIVPKANLPLTESISQLKVTGVEFLVEALELVLPGQKFKGGENPAPFVSGAAPQGSSTMIGFEPEP